MSNEELEIIDKAIDNYKSKSDYMRELVAVQTLKMELLGSNSNCPTDTYEVTE